jgi:hypothetical protein
LEFARQVGEQIQYEFYQEPSGLFLFKPPFLNFDAKQTPEYIIHPTALKTYSPNEGTDVATYFTVYGSTSGDHLGHAVTGNMNPVTGIAVDPHMARRYGFRRQTRRRLYISSPEEAFIYAYAEMDVYNAMRRKRCSAQIMGRPELRPGWPVYFRHNDMYWYLRGLTHNFTFGGSFTTNLELVAPRKRIFKDGSQRSRNQNSISRNLFREFKKPITQADIANALRAAGSAIKALGSIFGGFGALGDSMIAAAGQISKVESPNKLAAGINYYEKAPPVQRGTGRAVTASSKSGPKKIDKNLVAAPNGEWALTQLGASDQNVIDPRGTSYIRVTDNDGFEVIGFWSWGRGVVVQNGEITFLSPDVVNDVNQQFVDRAAGAIENVPAYEATVPHDGYRSGDTSGASDTTPAQMSAANRARRAVVNQPDRGSTVCTCFFEAHGNTQPSIANLMVGNNDQIQGTILAELIKEGNII